MNMDNEDDPLVGMEVDLSNREAWDDSALLSAFHASLTTHHTDGTPERGDARGAQRGGGSRRRGGKRRSPSVGGRSNSELPNFGDHGSNGYDNGYDNTGYEGGGDSVSVSPAPTPAVPAPPGDGSRADGLNYYGNGNVSPGVSPWASHHNSAHWQPNSRGPPRHQRPPPLYHPHYHHPPPRNFYDHPYYTDDFHHSSPRPAWLPPQHRYHHKHYSPMPHYPRFSSSSEPEHQHNIHDSRQQVPEWAPPPPPIGHFPGNTMGPPPGGLASFPVPMPSGGPPTVGLGTDEDALANLLMAWYYSGYYTGRYQALQEAQRSAQQGDSVDE